MKKNTFIWIGALFLFILLIFAARSWYNDLAEDHSPDRLKQKPSQHSSSQYDPAPDFTVLDWEGNEVSLSDYKGTPVVVNFWASWCPPCKAELPDFDEAAKKYQGEVAFLMVNLTDNIQETVSGAKRFIEASGYSFPVFFDTNSDAAMANKISSIPVTLFIDSDGNLVTRATGMLDAATLESGIDMILK